MLALEVCPVRPKVLGSGCRTVSNNGSGSGLAPAQNILTVQVWFGFTWAPFSRFRFTKVKYYWFGSGSLTWNLTVVTRFVQKKKREIADLVDDHHCSYCACTSTSGIRIWKNIFLLLLEVQIRFGFTWAQFCGFRFGSGSPKWNGSFGFTVRVQVRFDTMLRIVQFGQESCPAGEYLQLKNKNWLTLKTIVTCCVLFVSRNFVKKTNNTTAGE